MASVLSVLGLAHCFLADEPKVCVGGADDGKTCTVPENCAAPGVCTADDVRAYAKGCYDRLQIKPLTGPFKCKNGNQLVVAVDGKIQDINCPKDNGNNPTPAYTNCGAGQQGKPNPDNAGSFLATCDNPT
jgi:hypothetical protein